jgi:hypothetical protein
MLRLGVTPRSATILHACPRCTRDVHVGHCSVGAHVLATVARLNRDVFLSILPNSPAEARISSYSVTDGARLRGIEVCLGVCIEQEAPLA